MDLSFNSDLPIDRLVFTPNMEGGSGSISVPGNTFFASFTVDNSIGVRFLPFIRYSQDGGTTWFFDGDRTPSNALMRVLCSNGSLTVYYENQSSSTVNIQYEIFGISEEV